MYSTSSSHHWDEQPFLWGPKFDIQDNACSYIYIYIYTCMYIYIYIYTHTCTYIHTHPYNMLHKYI